MHISEGLLAAPVLISGAALGAAGTAIGLKKLDYDQIARAGILAAAFFVASLVHVPIGPASAHLILNGLVGLMLGWGAFPAILVALALQAVLFQFGGITTLGVNTVIMALPAVICHYLFSPLIRQRPPIAFAAGCACGVIAVLLSALLAALALIGSQTQFTQVAMLLAGAHLPVMIIEGLVTGFCIAFLLKVKPSLLQIQEDTP